MLRCNRKAGPAAGGGATMGHRILTIAGTRPEAIKLAPVALGAARRPGLDLRLVATGQHDTMFEQVIDAFGVTVDRHLALAEPGQSIEALAARVADAIRRLIDELDPALILVQGDTTSAWAAAKAAHQAGVPVGHVEAGLRSHDMALPWPEERNRVEIDAMASLLFAPTDDSRHNLLCEPAVTGAIHVTGNTGIDALLAMRARVGLHSPEDSRKLILVTCHRRENIGAGIAGICDALHRLAERSDVRIVLPVHPNPAVRGGVESALAGTSIELVPPLGYPEMVRFLVSAHLILSDSGGLQEEAPALGIPLLVMRDNTERPEALACGNIALVGTDSARIIAEATRLLDDPAAHAVMARPAFPYGRGDAAEKILDIIEDWLAKGHETSLPAREGLGVGASPRAKDIREGRNPPPTSSS
jgi:UDP-N-acetylglucosamine 2-epimerase (non-hydrolysing)